MTRPASLSADEAKEKIRLILAQGKVELSYHCKRDSMPKRSVTLPDIVNTLQTGEIRRVPEWDDEHDNWKYRVEGVDIEGDDLAAITIVRTGSTESATLRGCNSPTLNSARLFR